MKIFTQSIRAVSAAAVCLCMTSCTGFLASVETVDVEHARHYDQGLDYTDLRDVSTEMATAILAGDFLDQKLGPPVVIFGDIKNGTSAYLDTRNLSDLMRTTLFKSGKVQLINGSEPGTVASGQPAARYRIRGAIREMKSQSADQTRISRKMTSYYRVNVEVTDLETGVIAWTDDRQFAREANVPMLRW